MGRLYVDLTGLLRIVYWSGAKFLDKIASSKCIRNTSPEQKKMTFLLLRAIFYAFTIPLMSNVQCLINASVIPSTEHSHTLIHRTLML